MHRKMKFPIILFIFSLVARTNNAQEVQQVQKDATLYEFQNGASGGTGKFYMGREIARVIGAAGAGWLERSGRQQEEDNNRTISKLPITSASVVADVGAGTGYYTFRIAKKLPEG